MMENCYNTCIYDILQEPTQPREVCQIMPPENQNRQVAQQVASDYNGRCTGAYNVPGIESVTLPSNTEKETARRSNDR